MTLTFGAPSGGWPSFGLDGKREKPQAPYTVYLAGPMRGYSGCNYSAFDWGAALLRDRLGWNVVSPAEHDRETYGDRLDATVDCSDDEITFFDITEAMAWDLGAIEQADAVVVLPNWETSRGVRSELAHAGRHQKPVLFLTDLGLWDPVEMRLSHRWAK